MHLHEVDAHEERFASRCGLIEVLGRCLFDILIEEGDADDTLLGGVDVLSIDLEVLARGLPRISRQCTLGYPLKHCAKLRVHIGEPGRIAVRVGIEMIQPAVSHFVEALRVGQRVVGFAQVPLAGEEGVVPSGLQHGSQSPLRCRKSTALPLEGHRCHSASVGNTAGHHGGATGRATRLGVEGQERHTFPCETVEVGSRHSPIFTTSVSTGVSIAEVIGYNEDDVGLLSLRLRLCRNYSTPERDCRHQRRIDCTKENAAPGRCPARRHSGHGSGFLSLRHAPCGS